MNVLMFQAAQTYEGPADMLFTNPYGEVPRHISHKPAIINLYEGGGSRRAQCEEWMHGATLKKLSTWGFGQRNTVYVSNLPVADISLEHFVEDTTDAPPNVGWFPLPMVIKLLSLYAPARSLVWDGFCGRGTVGKGCAACNLDFVGMDNDEEMYNRARRYLGLVNEET